jgi:hypothetical protein
MYILVAPVYIHTALFSPCTLSVACLLKTPSYVTTSLIIFMTYGKFLGPAVA